MTACTPSGRSRYSKPRGALLRRRLSGWRLTLWARRVLTVLGLLPVALAHAARQHAERQEQRQAEGRDEPSGPWSSRRGKVTVHPASWFG